MPPYKDIIFSRDFNRFILTVWQWSTTNWCFQEWLNNTLFNNTIECKKLATIVSGWKNVARPFLRCKHVRNSAEMLLCMYVRYCYISALLLTCFLLKKGRATFFWTETIITSFLHSMVLLPKVLLNHSFKSTPFLFRIRAISWTMSEIE